MKIVSTAQIIQIALIFFICTNCIYLYAISPTAAVVIAGAKIKARKVDDERKYPRSKCPVCKGTGKIKGGDTVVEVETECPHCYPDKDKSGDLPDGVEVFSTEDQEKIDDSVTHPPAILDSKCEEGKCEPKPKQKQEPPAKPSAKPSKPTTIYRR